jgi:hypothetical protein
VGFYQISIQGNIQEFKSVKTEVIGINMQIVEVLSTFQEENDKNDKPYLPSTSSVKCLVTILNEKSLLEVLFIEISSEDLQVIWRQLLPDQSSKGTQASSTRINQRGTVVPV